MKARRLGAALLLTALLLAPLPASGQEAGEEESIFRRFSLKPTAANEEQLLLEIPVRLRPQTDPAADVQMNAGLQYVTSYRPDNGVYLSRSVGFAATRWNPTDTGTSEVSVTTADISFLLNIKSHSGVVTSLGIGLGVMDGLIVYTDARNFETRLELFFPIQFGVAWRLAANWQVGLKATQFSFFRQNPVISLARVLFGVGYSY